MSPGQYVGKTNIGKIIKLHEGSNEEGEQSRKEMAEGKKEINHLNKTCTRQQ